MATGAVPASFTNVKTWNSNLGFAKSIDFVRVADLKSIKSARTKVSIIRNSNPGQDIAELQPASEGSPLLGMPGSNLLCVCVWIFVEFNVDLY